MKGAALILALVLAGCSQTENLERGSVGYIEGFFGGVAAEEPTAALVGRDILTSGGNAADAAVGMAFSLSVTFPSAVSLGGGGACLVHDAQIGITEALDFVPPAGTGQSARPSAVPSLARGMAALHARYGEFRWSSVVSPAERLARLGHRVSRAFAQDVLRAAEPLYKEPTIRAVFEGAQGRLVAEGDWLIQPDLATVLGQIRANGAGALYTGRLARRLVAAARAVGGSLTAEDLTSYTPTWQGTILVPYGNNEMHFAPPPAVAGPMEAVMWRLLTQEDLYANASPEDRAHIFAEITKRASEDRKDWITEAFTSQIPVGDIAAPERVAGLMEGFDIGNATPGVMIDPKRRQSIEIISGTGFVVTDTTGMTVACSLSLYNPFGIGRVASGTGILLSAAPGFRGRNPLGLGPMIAINSNSLKTLFAIASGGGPLAVPATVQVTADTLLAGIPLSEAISSPRQLAVETPDTVLVEKGRGDALAAQLSSKGHPVQRFNWRGRVSAIHCPEGLGPSSEDRVCEVVQDPRGSGLAAFSEAEE